MTRITYDQVDALRALLVGDYDEHRRLATQLDLDGSDAKGFLNLLDAAFFEIVDRRFANSTSMDEVVSFVADVRSRNEEAADSINPDVAERLILHSHGRAKIDDIDDSTKLGAKMMLLPLLVREEHYSEDQLDQFMASSRATADDWLAKDEAEGRNV